MLIINPIRHVISSRKMSEIENLWNEFIKTPFPINVAGEEIEGIDPVTVDSFAAGCISSFITSGNLDQSRKNILYNCMSELRKMNPELTGEAQVYFGKLYRLCDLVYAQV